MKNTRKRDLRPQKNVLNYYIFTIKITSLTNMWLYYLHYNWTMITFFITR